MPPAPDRPVFQLQDVHAGGSVILVYGGWQQRIGGPLPGAALIANFLAQYRDSPERPQPFGGRREEFRRLDSWLGQAEQPYLLVAAPPGRGKSSLVARWCDRLTAADRRERLQIVFVPISIRFEFNRQATVLRALATRLAAVHGEPAFGDSADDWRDVVGELMLRSPPEGTRVLVVIDGLDETSGWQFGPSLFPQPPHPDVKLLVSARLTASHSAPSDWLQDLGWSRADVVALGTLSEGDVQDVLTHMGPSLSTLADDPGLVAKLHEISGGDPLVVGLYASHLWAHPFQDRGSVSDWLRDSSGGLAGFLDRWWEDQQRLWGDAASAQTRRVFDLLTSALGPLERRGLLELARLEFPISGDDLDFALGALDRLLISPSPRVFAIAHPRLQEHRLARLRDDGDLAALDRVFIEWTGSSLIPAPEEPAPYAVRHLGQHLERAQADPGRHAAAAQP